MRTALLLRVEDVCFAYENPISPLQNILVDVNFCLDASEILCIMGQTGSGKTTLLNLIIGLLTPSAGIVDLYDNKLSYLTQDNLLIPFRTVWQNALFAAELTGKYTDEAVSRATGLLKMTDLSRTLDDMPQNLSGGMRRRLAFVRQLVNKADILLLDEPFSAQDYIMKGRLEEIVYRKCHTENIGSIIVTHDTDSAVALAHKILVLGRDRRLSEQWECPTDLARISPTQRRKEAAFADQVALVWRRFWETTTG